MSHQTAPRLTPLSMSQRNIWNAEQALGQTPINNISATLRIRGRLDVALLEKSLNLVVCHNQGLRTQLTMVDGVPYQYTAEYREQQYQVYDFSMTDETGIEHWERTLTRQVMPLYDVPLFDFAIFTVGEGNGGFFMKTHHIISDGYAQMFLTNQIAKTYLDLLAGKEPVLEELADYALHIEEEQRYLESPMCRSDERYWREQMAGIEEPTAIKEHRGAVISPVGQRKTYALSQRLNHALRRFSMEHRVSPFAPVCMALAVYLKRIQGQDRSCIGVPIVNRGSYREKNTFGMFVSTLPFLLDIDEEWSFEEFNENLSEQWYDLLRHQKYPFERIEGIAKEKGLGGRALFSVVLSFQFSQAYQGEDAEVYFTGRWHYSGYQSQDLLIHLSNFEDTGRYSIDYDYLTQIFSGEEISRLHHYLINILTDALKNPQKPLWQLGMMDPEEEEQVLYTLNDTRVPLRRKSLGEELFRIAAKEEKKIALICHGEKVSYQRLYEQAAGFAEAIGKYPAAEEKDPLAAILLPRGEGLIYAMTGAALCGVGWTILNEDLPEGRIAEILEESKACCIVTTKALKQEKGIEDERFLDADKILPLKGYQPVAQREDATAYVVYTSGSTGKPKGVEVGQRSLLNFAEAAAPLYQTGGVLSICNVGFDAFLLESMAALLNKKTVVLAGGEEAEDPRELAGLIQSYGVGFLACTPTRLSAYLKEPSFAAAMGRIRSVVLGGEHFPSELLSTLKRVSHADIYNQYGPSEATIGVSYQRLNDAEQITCGKPMDNCRIYILGAHQEPVPIGVAAEVYLGGQCIAKGYRNDEARTREAFLESPFDPGERLYRTGDIGQWNQRGELLILGRRDQQVKLRGLRIEIAEIEARLMGYPGIQHAAVRVVQEGEHGFLAAYYTAEKPVSEIKLRSYLATFLPGYMIPVYYEKLDAIPLSANGKTDYCALPQPQGKAAPRLATGQVEQKLLRIFQQVLGRQDIDAGSNYFLYGGDSLNAAQTLIAIEQEFGVRLRMADLYAMADVRHLAELLGERQNGGAQTEKEIPPAPEQETYPLSPAQRNLYVLKRTDPTGIAYNMPGTLFLGEQVDRERLKKAFDTIIKQEELLRTAFLIQNGEVVQKVCEAADFELPILDASSLGEAQRSFVRPFDETAPPMLRAALYHDPSKGWALLMDVHHMISDGISTPVLLQRLDQAYQKGSADAPALRYKDYAHWMAGRKTDAAQQEYYQRTLEGAPHLELHYDYPHADFNYRGAHALHRFSQLSSERMEAYAKKRGVSAFMLLCCGLGVALSKLTGAQDMVIGTPVSGRQYPGTQQAFGAFINTLPLRLQPQEDQTFLELVQKVRQEVLGMLDHQDITLEEILSGLDIRREKDGNPLYNVLFSMRPIDASAFCFAGRPIEYAPIETGTAKMDLSVEAYREEGRYCLSLEYASARFTKETAEILGRCIEAALVQGMQQEDCPIAEISGISAQDRMKYYERPWRRRTPYEAVPIDVRVDEMAQIDPEGTAIDCAGHKVSFSELKRRSDGYAAALQKRGVKRKDVVAFLCERDEKMIAAMLGILKCGAAYLPLDAAHPAERIGRMLAIAEAKAVFYSNGMEEALSGADCEKIPMETQEGYQPAETRCMEDGAYVLFTSGSTGEPKGVLVPHRGIANLLSSIEELYDGFDGKVLCSSNVVFDVCIAETLIPLALDRGVAMADRQEMLLPWKIAKRMEESGTKWVQFTPSRMQMCMANEPFLKALRSVDTVVLAGEVLTDRLAEEIREQGVRRIYNLYGPTEATVYATGAEVSSGPVHIGKPQANCRGYVLDERKRLLPPTARGTLYLAGECLAKGYIHRPELTEQVFLEDPFYPGKRMYQTGDRVRMRADGNLDYLGRADDQVKFNGLRVELLEIQEQMLQSGLCKEAAVITQVEEGSVRKLRGFYVPKEGACTEKLRQALAAQLPGYMVPAELCALEELPKTSSGKTDRRALSMLQEKNAGEDGTSGRRTMETPRETTALENIWKRVLKREQIDGQRSFFEQGGSSLSALMVLSEYFNIGFEMTLQDFYNAPYLRIQEQRRCGMQKQSLPLEGSVEEEEPIETVPAYPRFLPGRKAAKGKRDTVFLTGATGYLGAHLIRALRTSGTSRVLCLCRNEQKALYDTLDWYFGAAWTSANRSSIQVIQGDITKPRFGLDEQEYNAYAQKADCILHAAADVRHYGSGHALMDTNLLGTQHAIAFAKAAKGTLHHISTASICAEYCLEDFDRETTFYETDFDIGQNWQDNLYIESKFLAEKQVMDAMEKGMDACIYRVGRLVGRQSDGAFLRDPERNAFYRIVQGIRRVGAIPRNWEENEIEMTAVDACAEAIVALMEGDEACYHVLNPNLISLGEALDATQSSIQRVEEGTFLDCIRKNMEGEGATELASLIDLYNRTKGKRDRMHVSAAHTQQVLHGLGFEWRKPSPKVLLSAYFAAEGRGKGGETE